MSKDDVKIKGVVVDCLPNCFFMVELENQKTVRAYLAGKMKLNRIKVLLGDKVEVVVPDQGEIYRLVRRS